MTDRETKMLRSYRLLKLARYDDIGTVRTGKQWFDRYMIYPWERPGDFAPLNA